MVLRRSLLARWLYCLKLVSNLHRQLTGIDPIDNTPNNNGDHLGSSWDVGWYGSVQEDLINLLKASKKPRPKAKTKHTAKRSTATTTKRKAKPRAKRKPKKKAAPKPVIFCGAG